MTDKLCRITFSKEVMHIKLSIHCNYTRPYATCTSCLIDIIFIHNGPRGSHDTSDIKLVDLQLVRYSYFVNDATLARQADRFVANIISWCRPSTSQSLNRLPSG